MIRPAWTIGSNRSVPIALLLGATVWLSLMTWENLQNNRHQLPPTLALNPVQTQLARASLRQIMEGNIRLFNAAKAHNWQTVRLELQSIQQANQQLKSLPASTWNRNGLEQDIGTLTQAVHVKERPVIIETSTSLLINAVNQADSLQRVPQQKLS